MDLTVIRQGLLVDGSNILLTANVRAANGIIHVITDLLRP